MCDSGTDDKKIICYKVTRADYPGNSCAYKDWDSLRDSEFDGAEFGDKITIELVQMTESEFDDMGEFEGW